MIKSRRLLRVALAGLLTLGCASSVGAQQRRRRPPRLRMTGTVVAYEWTLLSLVQLTHVEQKDWLVVRVDGGGVGRAGVARYVKIFFRYHDSRNTLPNEIYDGRRRWAFVVTRERACDGALGSKLYTEAEFEKLFETLPAEKTPAAGDPEEIPLLSKELSTPKWVRTVGAEREALDAEAVLPCYEMRREDFRPLPGGNFKTRKK